MTHRIEARVYYEDTDAGGVVYHANYLKFMERSRTEWLRSAGIESEKLMNDRRLCFVVSRIEIAYKRPARLDDLLSIETVIESQTATRLHLRQNTYRGEEVIAEAHVDVAMLNLDTGRGTRIPEDLLAVLA